MTTFKKYLLEAKAPRPTPAQLKRVNAYVDGFIDGRDGVEPDLPSVRFRYQTRGFIDRRMGALDNFYMLGHKDGKRGNKYFGSSVKKELPKPLMTEALLKLKIYSMPW